MRRRLEVREQRPVVELEIGRRDHGHPGRLPFGRVLGELDRGERRLRTAVDDHVERAVDEELGDAHPLLGVEQDALAGGAEREDAVEAAAPEEVEVRRERVLVELVPASRSGVSAAAYVSAMARP